MIIDDRDLRRFWTKVEKSESCWIWKGTMYGSGYGMFFFKRKCVGAHRISWEIANQSLIPAGMLVCHRCDNPACVNPDHLFVGTQSQNMRDMMSKGRNRTPRGEESKNAKLTEIQAARVAFGGEPLVDLAKEFGVCYQCVWQVRKRRRWNHVTPSKGK